MMNKKLKFEYTPKPVTLTTHIDIGDSIVRIDGVNYTKKDWDIYFRIRKPSYRTVLAFTKNAAPTVQIPKDVFGCTRNDFIDFVWNGRKETGKYYHWIEYNHSLWTVDKKPKSIPLHVDYMDFSIDSREYHLSKLVEHIKKLVSTGKILLVGNGNVEIIKIPYYNCSDGRTHTINVDILIPDNAYARLYKKCRVKKEHRDGFPDWYYTTDSWNFHTSIKEYLGFEKFREPESVDEWVE